MAVKNVDRCPCCGRQAWLTFHHLIPKKVHRRPYFRKKVPKEAKQQGILICRQCHDAIHKFYDEMTIAKHLNTLSRILDDPTLAKHFEWVAKQTINVK